MPPKKKIDFLKTALSDYKVGAISRSSKYVVRSVLHQLPGHLNTVVEFGPGDGVITKAILERISKKGRLVVIESNPDFVKALRKIRDPRLLVIRGKVQDIIMTLDKYLPSKADAILSSVPFSFFTASDRKNIVLKISKLLSPKGIFISFHQYRLQIVRQLKSHFNKVNIIFEPRNILPCFIISARNK